MFRHLCINLCDLARHVSLKLPENDIEMSKHVGVNTIYSYYKSVYSYSVSQPPGRGPVPGPGINYTGSREVLLEFVILVF